MLDRFDLNKKVILLTGGAGLYGHGLSQDIASAGARLVIASRNLAACEKVAHELRDAGYEAFAESFDQGDETSILRLKDFIQTKFGRLDGLVNNSVARPMRSADAPLGDWEESIRINSTGVFLMHRHFGKMMQAANAGSIINIGSIQGMVGPNYSLYEGTSMGDVPADYFFHKGGMISMTRYFAALYGPAGVRVNCLSPGGFFNHQSPDFVKRYCAETMLGRMGNKTDLGGSVVFLLSDASLYITGVNLPVDGGYTAK